MLYYILSFIATMGSLLGVLLYWFNVNWHIQAMVWVFVSCCLWICVILTNPRRVKHEI